MGDLKSSNSLQRTVADKLRMELGSSVGLGVLIAVEALLRLVGTAVETFRRVVLTAIEADNLL